MEKEKMIRVYRFQYTIWSDIDNKWEVRKGYVSAYSLGDAVTRLDSINRIGDNEASEIESIDMLYEIDCYDDAILFDETIEETEKAEKKSGKE